MMIELDAYLDGTLIGQVRQSTGGSVTFEYDSEYQRVGRTPLSLSMPLERTVHGNKAAGAFLAGLLPDSEGRLKSLAQRFHVNWKNPAALLEHIGADAAGAIQLTPQGFLSADAAARRGDVTVHSEDEFAELISDIIRNKETWATSHRGGKWSLPGAQPKVALFKTPQGEWATPNDSTPTTHILKPSIPPYSDHHINEFMTMAAARHLGMNVARDEVVSTKHGEHVFVSQRYDRAFRDGAWHRLHQEDLCQALSVKPDKKYQNDGGPSVKQISRLLSRSSDPANRRENLLAFYQALVLNVAMQGTDAHAKNYSLMLSDGEVRLAPLYDLGSHAPYGSVNNSPLELAMAIGGEYRIDAVSLEMLTKTGTSLGIDAEEARTSAAQILASTPDAFAAAAEEAKKLPNLHDKGSHKFIDLLTSRVAEYADNRGWIQRKRNFTMARTSVSQSSR